MAREPAGLWSAEEFSVDVLDEEGLTVVLLSGELDLSTAPVLRECLERLSSAVGRTVLMDLTNLTFVDSSGISALIMGCKRTRAQGGSFSLISPQPTVRRVLQMQGVFEYLNAPVES